MKIEDLIDAYEVTSTTLIGSFGDFPRSVGNCFSLKTDIDKDYRIVNFNAENLDELLKRGLTWPVKILPMNERIAIICDARISDKWYDERYCSICCPDSLLPHPQLASQLREIDRGDRVEKEVEYEGKKMTIVKLKMGDYKKQDLL